MAFEAGRGGSGLEPKLAGLRLTPADFAGPRRRTPQDLGRILAGPDTGPSGPAVLGGPIWDENLGSCAVEASSEHSNLSKNWSSCTRGVLLRRF